MKKLNYYSFDITASEHIKDTYNPKYKYLSPNKLYSKFTHKNHEDDALGNTFFFPKDNDNLRANDRIPPHDYKFYDFYVNDGAEQVDDFMDNPDINSSFGFILSVKAKNIFEQFILPDHKFFPVNVIFNGKNHEYYFLLVAKENQPINYNQSSFEEWYTDQEVEINNYIDLSEYIPSKNGNVPFYQRKNISETKIIFNKELDLYSAVTLTNSWFYFSERLKKAIQKAELSGILIHKATEPLFFSSY
ncbi:hypothetical protein [Aureivirga sp. CE67]|uniref:hypothetical protein n=1 Tax=Aureivirga sp. CE67 TaxID=1788983 RepID=UPI0018CB3C78|nr:hypothetical protein [Aureivirga sp. CE67]